MCLEISDMLALCAAAARARCVAVVSYASPPVSLCFNSDIWLSCVVQGGLGWPSSRMEETALGVCMRMHASSRTHSKAFPLRQV
jgi:hypothetical protein